MSQQSTSHDLTIPPKLMFIRYVLNVIMLVVVITVIIH